MPFAELEVRLSLALFRQEKQDVFPAFPTHLFRQEKPDAFPAFPPQKKALKGEHMTEVKGILLREETVDAMLALSDSGHRAAA